MSPREVLPGGAEGHPERAWVNRGDKQCPWNYRVRGDDTEFCCALKEGHLAPHVSHTGFWGDDQVLDVERERANRAVGASPTPETQK